MRPNGPRNPGIRKPLASNVARGARPQPVRARSLDYVIIAKERGLHDVVSAYVEFCLNQKFPTHLALCKDALVSQSVASPADEQIVAIPHLGGLHHRYERRAA